jgi:hypothetical protein
MSKPSRQPSDFDSPWKETEDIVGLLRFIDGVLALPKELEIEFWEEVNQIEEGKRMPVESTHILTFAPGWFRVASGNLINIIS